MACLESRPRPPPVTLTYIDIDAILGERSARCIRHRVCVRSGAAALEGRDRCASRVFRSAYTDAG